MSSQRRAQFPARGVAAGIVAIVACGGLYSLSLADAWQSLGFGNLPYWYLFHTHIGFYFFSVLAYALGVTGLPARVDVTRIVRAQGALFFTLCVMGIVTFPYAFGLAEGSGAERYYGPWALFVTCVLVGAIVHRRVLRSGVPARFEIPAHIAAFAIPSFVFDPDLFKPGGDWANAHVFGQAPALAALVPFIAIVAMWAPATTIRRGVLIVVLAVVPLYFGKAFFDLSFQRPMALLWPARVVANFMPLKERTTLARRLEVGVLPGATIRVGEHWYRFQNFSSSGARANQDGVPDRLISLSLGIPKSELGLPAKGKWILVRIEAGSPRLAKPPRVGVRYEDLTIDVAKDDQPDWPADEKVREILLAFITAARMPDPPPAESGTAR